MKKSMKAAVCGLVLVGSLGLGMIAEAGRIPSHMVPLQTYATKKVTCYKSPGGAAQGWIDAGDYVIVNQIRNDGWAYGSYPVKNGRTSRWFRVDDLLNNPSFRTLDRMSPSYKVNVYKNYSYNGTIGSIWGNENIWVVSNLGDVWQIVYKVNNGGYKMGWVPYWDCLEKPVSNPFVKPVNRNQTSTSASSTVASTSFSWPVKNKYGINTIYYYNGRTGADGKYGGTHACRYYAGGTNKPTTKPYGIDINVGVGTPVFSIGTGVVKTATDLGGKSFGKYVEVDHGNNRISLYAHLSKINVGVGNTVNSSTQIGLSGNSGNSGGPHLHFEMSWQDPYEYYKKNITFTYSSGLPAQYSYNRVWVGSTTVNQRKK